MIRHTAAIIALGGLSVILKDVLNATPQLQLQLTSLDVLVPLLLFYAVHQWVARQVKFKAGRQALFYQRVQQGLHFILGVVTVLLLIGIPLLWWGVIQKLAVIADGGGNGL